AVRVAVSRMVKQGWLVSEKQGSKSFYSLTPRGVERMEEAARRIYKSTPHDWDGKWRTLMYTIPEDKRQIRDELRKELTWSGFGNLSNGVWISPNPLEKEAERLIEAYEIEEYVDFFVGEYHGPKQDQSLVERAFPLEELQERYETFITDYSRQYIVHQSQLQLGEMTDEQCFVERTMLVHEYRKFLFTDPGLPQELLPDAWSGHHAALLFEQYYRLLAQPASRFFESIFEETHDVSQRSASYDATEHPLFAER
ncbi:PaaX family transcriptional regulator C-terminal domain-containing protein, partial [Exiguobacterium sp.]